MKNELCIIRPGVAMFNGHVYSWFNKRKPGLVRHEVFFGKTDRNLLNMDWLYLLDRKTITEKHTAFIVRRGMNSMNILKRLLRGRQ